MRSAMGTEREEPSDRTNRQVVRRALILTLVIGLALVSAFALIGDARDLADAFQNFDWWLILPIFALTIWNYGWRFRKWQLYLHELGVEVPTGVSARIFLSGFAMSLTPGKVGEVIKAVYVRRLTGAPVNRTSAVVAAERITDALAMLLLAAVGATEYAYGRPLLAVVAACGTIGILLMQHPAMLSRQVERVAGVPFLGRIAIHGTAFIDASSTLFRPGVLLRAIALGVVSWSGECLAFFLVLIGLGVDPSPRLLLVATFILAVSSLAGGASMLPGGLGVADAGIAGLLVLLLKDDGMTGSTAAAATIVIRFATLWFAVILGAVALAHLERRWGRVETAGLPVQSTAQTETRNRIDAPGGFEAIGDGGNL